MKSQPLFEIHLQCHPPVLKNSKQIIFNRRTGKRMVIPNKAYAVIANAAIWEIKSAWRAKPPIIVDVHLRLLFGIACFESSKSRADLSNLYQGPEDWLEGAGVIANDRQIRSHDGSRIICLCDDCEYVVNDKRKCPGVKKCDREYVDIKLEAME